MAQQIFILRADYIKARKWPKSWLILYISSVNLFSSWDNKPSLHRNAFPMTVDELWAGKYFLNHRFCPISGEVFQLLFSVLICMSPNHWNNRHKFCDIACDFNTSFCALCQFLSLLLTLLNRCLHFGYWWHGWCFAKCEIILNLS